MEICIAGDGLAGYLHSDELTEEICANPFVGYKMLINQDVAKELRTT
jgi:hypothetical protein